MQTNQFLQIQTGEVNPSRISESWEVAYIDIVNCFISRAKVNQQPQIHRAAWMVCGEQTLLHCILIS
jgi:hypothetical protein